jgi:hypothetical protein
MVTDQAHSILVKLDQEPKDYAIRLNSLRVEQTIEGWGILRYHDPRSVSLCCV